MPFKYVGVTAAALNNENLKRAALLCDEVVCNGVVGEAHRAVELGIVRPALKSESQRALSSIPEACEPKAWQTFAARKADVDEVLAKLSHEVDVMSGVVAAHQGSRLPDTSKALLRQSFAELGRITDEFGDLWTRMHAELMRLSLGDNIYLPILYHAPVLDLSLGTRAKVVRVIFESLPRPGADTPWEAIADWRRDPEANEKYRVLRAWIARLASSDARDVAEELAANLATYERYMAIQHRKMQRTRLEAIVLPIAEIAEDTVHLRLSRAAAKLFGLFKDEITLLESELSAPGREVAYLTASRARFGNGGPANSR